MRVASIRTVVLKHAEAFEIMTPESMGLKESSLVMSKHLGAACLPREAERPQIWNLTGCQSV